MRKDLKGTMVFLIIAFLFWSILAILTARQINTEINYTENDLKTFKGNIVYLEQRESNGFYYFCVDSIPDVMFRITEVEKVSYSMLEEVKKCEQQIVFSVIETEYSKNKYSGDIEIVSIQYAGEEMLSLEEFCNRRLNKHVLRLSICLLMAGGMLASYIYLRKKYIALQKRETSIYSFFRN